MGNKGATTGANLVEEKIETTDTKFVREMLEKIENTEDKSWGLIACVFVSLEEQGGIEEIKKTLINDPKTDLMDFEESELIFYRIKDDRDEDGNPFSDSVQVIFILPNNRECVFYLEVLELNALRKELYLRYLNIIKLIEAQENEKFIVDYVAADSQGAIFVVAKSEISGAERTFYEAKKGIVFAELEKGNKIKVKNNVILENLKDEQ